MEETIVIDCGQTKHYESVCWYIKKNCFKTKSKLIVVGEKLQLGLYEQGYDQVNNIYFQINETETPIQCSEYEREMRPIKYTEIELRGTNVLAYIKKAYDEYQAYRKEFEQNDDEISVLTFHGAWHDEYKVKKRNDNSIYLPDNSFKKIIDDIKFFESNVDEYVRLGIPFTRTYMFHGVPGTGKTSTIFTIASKLNKHIAILDFSKNDIDDETIRKAFYRLPVNSILCLEDIDALFKDRKSDKPTVTFSGVLNILDGIVRNTGLLIFMTTNYLENLDDAAMKRRVDFYMKFNLMKRCQLTSMISHFFPKQDPEKFVNMAEKLSLTPCIVQKFFVRHLLCEDICVYFDELAQMCKNEYNLTNSQTSHMYT